MLGGDVEADSFTSRASEEGGYGGGVGERRGGAGDGEVSVLLVHGRTRGTGAGDHLDLAGRTLFS